MTIYGGSANRISTALGVSVEEAEKLLKNFFKLFPELKVYIDKYSTLARYQKWVQCPVTNRIYFVAESNAKSLDDDNSVARRACNFIIQGLSAIMTKRALWYTDELFEELNKKYSADIPIGKEACIVAAIHDCVIL